MGVTNAEFDILAIFLVHTVLGGNCVATRTVLRSIKRHAINGNRYVTESGSTFVITVCFWTVRCIVTTGRIVSRRTRDAPFVVLSTGAIVSF